MQVLLERQSSETVPEVRAHSTCHAVSKCVVQPAKCVVQPANVLCSQQLRRAAGKCVVQPAKWLVQQANASCSRHMFRAASKSVVQPAKVLSCSQQNATCSQQMCRAASKIRRAASKCFVQPANVNHVHAQRSCLWKQKENISHFCRNFKFSLCRLLICRVSLRSASGACIRKWPELQLITVHDQGCIHGKYFCYFSSENRSPHQCRKRSHFGTFAGKLLHHKK